MRQKIEIPEHDTGHDVFVVVPMTERMSNRYLYVKHTHYDCPSCRGQRQHRKSRWHLQTATIDQVTSLFRGRFKWSTWQYAITWIISCAKLLVPKTSLTHFFIIHASLQHSLKIVHNKKNTWENMLAHKAMWKKSILLTCLMQTLILFKYQVTKFNLQSIHMDKASNY